MAQYHSHDTHDHSSTEVVTEETGGPGVFLAIIAIVLIGFLIWLFAFSGMMFDRDNNNAPPRDETNVTNNFEQPPVQNEQNQTNTDEDPAISPS